MTLRAGCGASQCLPEGQQPAELGQEGGDAGGEAAGRYWGVWGTAGRVTAQAGRAAWGGGVARRVLQTPGQEQSLCAPSTLGLSQARGC